MSASALQRQIDEPKSGSYPNPAAAVCYQLRSICKTRGGKYMGDVSAGDLLAMENGVRQVSGLG